MPYKETEAILGNQLEELLQFQACKIPKQMIHLPGPDFVDRIFALSNRNARTLQAIQSLFHQGRLSKSGYLSILPVDQGVEHSAGASFVANPIYFDPENIVKLALEGGFSGVASTFGVLGAVSRKYAHHIPFIVKINHNELLSYPNKSDQIAFGYVKDAYNMGARGVGCTIYFGSPESKLHIPEIAKIFEIAHDYGLFTILWCYLRNEEFIKDGINYHLAADLTGQANYLGVTLQADFIKQKPPKNNGGFDALHFGKSDSRIASTLLSEHPIDLTRYQVINCYSGRSGLINSGGASGQNDFQEAVYTAVVNKRAGGMGIIAGRKVFQRSMSEGIRLIHAMQNVYLDETITVAE